MRLIVALGPIAVCAWPRRGSTALATVSERAEGVQEAALEHTTTNRRDDVDAELTRTMVARNSWMKLLVSAHSPSSACSLPFSCWAEPLLRRCCWVLLPCMLLVRCADDAADTLSELAHGTTFHRLSQRGTWGYRIASQGSLKPSTSHSRLRPRSQLTRSQTDRGAAWCVV